MGAGSKVPVTCCHVFVSAPALFASATKAPLFFQYSRNFSFSVAPGVSERTQSDAVCTGRRCRWS